MKYATHASEAFNRRLHEVILEFTAEVEAALGDNLVALLLGGGYGRGEGGVVVLDGEEAPYNDLDFTLVVGSKRLLNMALLEALSKRYASRLKIHVDFSLPLTVRNIQQWPHVLMWHDLLNGHMVLSGPEDLLEKNAPAGLRGPLPAIEGSRLLLNRGAGLLWAMRVARGVEPPEDGDFIRRNYFKCALAAGDALLIGFGRYASPYRGRDRLLDKLSDDEPRVLSIGLNALYKEALRFKFSPDRLPGEAPGPQRLEEIARLWGEAFLLVEQVRTGRDWHSLGEYENWPGIRESLQHTPLHLLRNLVRNRQVGKWDWRYPRERLFRSLPTLLGLTGHCVKAWEVASDEFLTIWKRFN